MSSDFHPVKRKGALTKRADAAGEGVQAFAHEHYHDSGLAGEQARFAVIAKSWNHGKHHKPMSEHERRSKGY